MSLSLLINYVSCGSLAFCLLKCQIAVSSLIWTMSVTYMTKSGLINVIWCHFLLFQKNNFIKLFLGKMKRGSMMSLQPNETIYCFRISRSSHCRTITRNLCIYLYLMFFELNLFNYHHLAHHVLLVVSILVDKACVLKPVATCHLLSPKSKTRNDPLNIFLNSF